uniref:uncharacterized protein LOC120347610 n=1 Tax=Styela clava TaxID=7725 RepID=UPI0019399D47|nr:uncharacterized protein LOC120347610 [Styela clava]
MASERLLHAIVLSLQSIQFALALFCLLSNTWLVTSNGEASQGLFNRCFPADNDSCIEVNDCLSCNSSSGDKECVALPGYTQGPDELIVGGLLTTSVIYRAIIMVITIFLLCTGEDSAPDMRKDLKDYLPKFEECSGVCDIGILGIYNFMNMTNRSGDYCFIFGAAYWVNYLRPFLSLLLLRGLPGCLHYAGKSKVIRKCVNRKTSKTPDT